MEYEKCDNTKQYVMIWNNIKYEIIRNNNNLQELIIRNSKKYNEILRNITK
jgi:hypothetical protein